MEGLSNPVRADAQAVADKALEDCGGNEPAARLLLAHQLLVARRGMTTGHLRLGANAATR